METEYISHPQFLCQLKITWKQSQVCLIERQVNYDGEQKFTHLIAADSDSWSSEYRRYPQERPDFPIQLPSHFLKTQGHSYSSKRKSYLNILNKATEYLSRGNYICSRAGLETKSVQTKLIKFSIELTWNRLLGTGLN